MLSKLAVVGTKQVARRALVNRAHTSRPAFNAFTRSLSTRKSWIPQNDEQLQKVTTQALVADVAEQQKLQASKVVPWFLENMPSSYFKQVPEGLQRQHIQAITTIRELMDQDLSLRMATAMDDGMYHVTFISSGTNIGLLYKQLQSLQPPEDHLLAGVDVFSSLDGTVALNYFTFVKNEHANAAIVTATEKDAAGVFAIAEEIKQGAHAGDPLFPAFNPLFEREAIASYIKNVTPNYASLSSPRRFLIQRMMFEKVCNSDGVDVAIEPYWNKEESASWVTIAAANVLPEVLMRLCCAIISGRGLDISRAHMDVVRDPSNSTPELMGSVVMLRMLVTSPEGAFSLNDNPDFAAVLCRDLKRSKWLDSETTELGLQKFPSLGLDKAEVVTSLCSMLHGPLSKELPQTFSGIASIIQTLETKPLYMNLADSLAQLFLDRFNPHHSNPARRMPKDEFRARCGQLEEKIQVLQNDVARATLQKMLAAIKATLRTNFFNEDRYALSLRVDPSIMSANNDMGSKEKPYPFGVFFVHGRHFNAFHCRFKDIARGGLRLVTPQNADQYSQESARQFDEVYGLSYAQQLKNKDIPEGGAKGVILVNTPAIDPKARFFAMRKAVKAFTDSMLDLIVTPSVSKLVDFYNKDELIYFGPDEQIIPSDIEWMVHRAGVRGYPIPDAVMSSKKDNGINHKEYGVTSEGVVVCMDVALRRSLGIDPTTTPFTVKITGGPDGDVAGNLMRILFRDYGDNAKIVGVADGFGVAEDPEGLDHGELLRLFKESKPITEFDASRLSTHGILLDVNSEDGVARRNTMHFRVKADVFVPAGGRPSTISTANWMKFLDDDGRPSSPLIVEGANIFITPDARQKLFENAKVAIVKDSSANKCGVITSSCEVAASMLLSKDEFMAIKEEVVDDVLVKLRHLARLEAELLFREYKNYPGSLPQFAERISFAINKVRDDVTKVLEGLEPSDPLFQELFPLIAEGLPKKLVEVAGDRIATRMPVQYQRNAIASALACKLVYKEGIHLVEAQPNDVVADRAIRYYREDKKMTELMKKLQPDGKAHFDDLSAEEKETVLRVLSKGGARTTLDIF